MLQQDIIDNISSGIIGLDKDYRVRLINPAAEALMQVSEARILGVSICELENPGPALAQHPRSGRRARGVPSCAAV
jgi:nitrogen-specific signal transduction histidine kinase